MTHDPVITEALKTCPFCGSAAMLDFNLGSEVYGQSWAVGCSQCTAKTGRCYGSNSWSKTSAETRREDESAKASAIAAWNTRTNPVVDVEGMVERIMPELEIPLHDYQRGGDSQAFLRQVVRNAIEAINSQGGV